MARFIVNSELESKILAKNDFIRVIQDDSFCTISFVNPFSYGLISNEKKVVEGIKYWFVDGQALCTLSNISRSSKIDRASFDFSSIATDFFEYASSHKIKLALIGGTEHDIEAACQNLYMLYPNIQVVYKRNGYLDKSEYAVTVTELDDVQSEIVIVGMGTPLQEDFSIYCMEESKSIRKTITCGGFFTQTAVSADFYHPLVKKFGLRWLQRAIMYKHVRKRLVKVYPKFIFFYVLDLIWKRR